MVHRNKNESTWAIGGGLLLGLGIGLFFLYRCPLWLSLDLISQDWAALA